MKKMTICSAVPAAIAAGTAERYPGAGIYKVERQPGGCEISIGNGLELICMAGGTFIREDWY